MLFSAIEDLKNVLEATLHLSRDALHVHVGLAIFLAGAALLRGERRFMLSFAILLGLCLIGEAADASSAWRHGYGANWLGGAKDVVNTMFWPGVWLLAGPQILRVLRLGRASPAVRLAGSGVQDPAR